MLKGLSGQDLINQNLIQGNNVEKLTSAKKIHMPISTKIF